MIVVLGVGRDLLMCFASAALGAAGSIIATRATNAAIDKVKKRSAPVRRRRGAKKPPAQAPAQEPPPA